MRAAHAAGRCAQVYKQKLKHLLYEHQANVAQLKADGELLLRAAGEEAAGREQELLKEKRALQAELREQAGLIWTPLSAASCQVL
jgi:hypothetical protein